MKKLLVALAIVLTCTPAFAGFFGAGGFGGFFPASEATYLSTFPNAEGIWEADYGTTIDVGVEFWDDQTGNYTQDKLNDAEQPALTTSANFNSQSVLDFNRASTQGMDASTFVDLTTKDQMTIHMVLEHDTAAATAVFAEVSSGALANSVCNILSVSSGTIRGRCKNSANAWISADQTVATNFTAASYTMIYDGSGGAGDIKLYKCGVQVGSATDATGGFNATSTRVFTMQAANDTTHADGKVAVLITDDDAWTAQQLANAVAIDNAKYGVCN